MQELRVLGRVLALAVVVALAWAMMGAGSRASLAHEPSATRSVKHAPSTTTSRAQRVVSWWYQIFHEGYSACSGLRGSDNGGPSEHMIRDCVVAIPGANRS